MIVVSDLTRRFGPLTAVDKLNFTVRPGEVLGFLGPNGAGKTTTMKLLTGFLTPTSGTASVFGYNVEQQSLAARSLIGYLPEGAPLYGDMTPFKLLKFVAEVRGLRGAHASTRIGFAIERLALAEVLHRPIEQLSKGFRRRVGIAQAILHEPKALILDEPTDGLDPNQKFEVRALISELAEERIIIVSTHILEEVEAVCTRALIIAHGKLVADGSPIELQRRSRYFGAVSVTLAEPVNDVEVLGTLAGASGTETSNGGRAVTVLAKSDQSGALFDLVRKIAEERNWPLLHVGIETGRLEEVFRTLTANRPGDVQ